MTILAQIILVLGIINLLRLSLLTCLTFCYGYFVKKSQLLKPPIGKFNSKGKRSYYKYNPLVSVIIAAYNEEKVIYRTLKTLFGSTYKNIEVVVVNDGSKDNTDREIRRFKKDFPDANFTYVKQKNGGKARALNNAINNYVSGKITMCLDADSVPKKDAIAKGVRYFRNRNLKAVAANVKILPETTSMNFIQRVEYLMGHHLKKSLTVGNVEYIIGGVGSMFRTSILRKVGGYDTDTITEDIDLTMKIVSLGNKKNLVIFAEDVIAYTEAPMNLHALYHQRFRWKFGRFQTFWKNRGLFFNRDKKYSTALTCLYLPYQLLSEFNFLLDPLFIIYVAYWAIVTGDISSYFGILLFVMFFTNFAVALDRDAELKDKLLLLLLTPVSYLMFFVVSVVEYIGLVKCICKWHEIVHASEYDECSWTPVTRKGLAV